MLACAGDSRGDFRDFQYMENECVYACALPHEVASVSNDIRDFRNENGEVKRVGNYFIGKGDLGAGMFAKVKKGIHVLTGELVRFRERGNTAAIFNCVAFPINLLAGGYQGY